MSDQKDLELSAFIAAMDTAFSDAKVPAPWPIWRLTHNHIPTLKGMAAVYDHWRHGNPYQALIASIQHNDSIGVDVTFPPNAGFVIWAEGYRMRKWPDVD